MFFICMRMYLRILPAVSSMITQGRVVVIPECQGLFLGVVIIVPALVAVVGGPVSLHLGP